MSECADADRVEIGFYTTEEATAFMDLVCGVPDPDDKENLALYQRVCGMKENPLNWFFGVWPCSASYDEDAVPHHRRERGKLLGRLER